MSSCWQHSFVQAMTTCPKPSQLIFIHYQCGYAALTWEKAHRQNNQNINLKIVFVNSASQITATTPMTNEIMMGVSYLWANRIVAINWNFTHKFSCDFLELFSDTKSVMFKGEWKIKFTKNDPYKKYFLHRKSSANCRPLLSPKFTWLKVSLVKLATVGGELLSSEGAHPNGFPCAPVAVTRCFQSKSRHLASNAVNYLCACPTPVNGTCHPGGHCRGYYPGTLPFSQVSATHLKIGHP